MPDAHLTDRAPAVAHVSWSIELDVITNLSRY